MANIRTSPIKSWFRKRSIFSLRTSKNSDYLNAIGVDSPFHETYGYYADPVDENTAVLPKNWKNRLSNLKLSGANAGIKAYCIDPHDLAVAKLAAGRDKDRLFIRELIVRKLVDPAVVQRRIGTTPVADAKKVLMVALLLRLVAECGRLTGGDR